MKVGRIRGAVAAGALVATLGACGAGAPSSDIAAPPTPAAVPAATGDFATSQAFDVRSYEVTSLDQIVTGDRAVLLWYWAPH